MADPKIYNKFLKRYNEFYTKILNYIYYRSGQDLVLAEDLTQEVFLKALEKYDTYDESRAFQAWLYTIARNHLTDFYRKRKERISYDLLENVLTTNEDLPQKLDRNETVRKVVELLPRLTPDEQELITLKYIQELETEEIADIIGKKPNAIYVGIHRAVKKLRQLINAEDRSKEYKNNVKQD